jgi:hypothetical protein
VDQVGVFHGSRHSRIRLFAIFKDGFMVPEDWIKWVMSFREIENLMLMKEPVDKTRMYRTLLKGQALSYFEHHLMSRLEAEVSEVPDNELIELVLRDVGLEYIPKHSIQGLNTSVQHFVERLNDLNRYLLYFPEENPKQLDQAKTRDPEWHEAMVNANIEMFKMSYKESASI